MKPMRRSNSLRTRSVLRAIRPASAVISPPSKSRRVSRSWRKEKEVWTAHCISKAGASRNSVLAHYHAISTLFPDSFVPTYE